MGEPNNALKVYMSRPDRIRSVLEYYLGMKLPADWKCEETGGFLAVRNTKGKLTFRQRDFLGKAQAWGVCFLLGLENQDDINLTYPWRLMEMDCLTYGREIEQIQEKNVSGNRKYGENDDFKYRFRQEDGLEPILNLTLYWGKKTWKRPRTLRNMMNGMGALPPRLRRLAGDYRIHIVCMRNIPEEDIQKMDSDLKYVLGIMRRTAHPKQYEEYIYNNSAYFSRIPKSAVDVIDACTNIKDIRKKLEYTFNTETGEEEANMCKALEDIKKDAVRRGVRQGVKQGERQGALGLLCDLVNDGLLKLDEAARRAKLSESAFCDEMRKAGYHT